MKPKCQNLEPKLEYDDLPQFPKKFNLFFVFDRIVSLLKKPISLRARAMLHLRPFATHSRSYAVGHRFHFECPLLTALQWAELGPQVGSAGHFGLVRPRNHRDGLLGRQCHQIRSVSSPSLSTLSLIIPLILLALLHEFLSSELPAPQSHPCGACAVVGDPLFSRPAPPPPFPSPPLSLPHIPSPLPSRISAPPGSPHACPALPTAPPTNGLVS
jgi:hypothetical protein